MLIKPWKTLQTTYLHPNFRVDTCELPNGQVITAHLLEYQDEILVFALNKYQEVVLVKQYRHGAHKVMIELPGGSIDQGESPLDAAKRELLEETGYSSDRFIELGRGSPNPAIYTNRMYSVLAIDAQPVGKQGVLEAETVEVLLVPLEEVIAMARQGNLVHSLNLAALFFVLGYLNRIC